MRVEEGGQAGDEGEEDLGAQPGAQDRVHRRLVGQVGRHRHAVSSRGEDEWVVAGPSCGADYDSGAPAVGLAPQTMRASPASRKPPNQTHALGAPKLNKARCSVEAISVPMQKVSAAKMNP